MGSEQKLKRRESGNSLCFVGWLGASLGSYVLLIVLLIIADLWFVLYQMKESNSIAALLSSEDIRASVLLTFVSSTVAAILAVFFAIPIGYVLSRFKFPGRSVIDAIMDIPVVLPPLVIGLSLLILFNSFPPSTLDGGSASLESLLNGFGIQVTNTKLAVVIAQFTVAAALAIRTMKTTFDQIDSRVEEVAMTLGASRGQAFFDVLLPQTHRGIIAAGTLSWARAVGEFGPILVFAGATRGKTEVLATSVYLEINTGNIEGAVVISLFLIILAMATIVTVRLYCERGQDHD